MVVASSEQSPVLVVDDNYDSQYVLLELVRKYGYRAIGAGDGAEALALAEETTPLAVISDVVMPGMNGFQVAKEFKSREALKHVPVILVTAKDAVNDIVEGLEAGADDYLIKPYEPLELMARLRAAVRLRELMSELNLQQEQNRLLVSELSERYDFAHIVGASAQMRNVISLIGKIVDESVPVLVTGPSGTGKELVARAIHYQSRRRHSPFIVKNCAGLQGELAEAELFGYERGSFTGAYKDRKGLFEAANGGTLFLDEIGETPLGVQAKLLRVLQEGRLLPVGATQEKDIDVRLVAATNRNLASMVEQGSFREDLYYRIHVIQIDLPALSERKEDIPVLAKHFLQSFATRRGGVSPVFTSEVLAAFSSYGWKGNVREMQNEIERMLIIGATRTELGLDLVSAPILRAYEAVCKESSCDCVARPTHGNAPERESISSEDGKLKEVVASLERRMIIEALEKFSGNRSQASLFLGISRSNLINKIKEYKIS